MITRRALLTLGLAVGSVLACSPASPPPAAPTPRPETSLGPTPAQPAPQPTAAAASPTTPPAPKPTATAAPAKRTDLTKARFAALAPAMQQAPIILGTEHGFYAADGLEIEMSHLDSDLNALKGVVAKQFEFAITNLAATLTAIQDGAPVTVLGDAYGPLPLFFAAKKEITDLKQLEGKSIAISTPGGLSDITVRLLLKDANVDTSKIQFAPVGIAGLVPALTSGTVDAGSVILDLIGIIESNPNLHVMFFMADKLPKYIAAGYIVHRDDVTQRRDLMVRLTKSQIRSTRYILDPKNKNEVVESMSKFLKREPAATSRAFDLYVQTRQFSPDFAISDEEIRYLQQINIDLGVQKEAIPVDRVRDNLIREAALAALK